MIKVTQPWNLGQGQVPSDQNGKCLSRLIHRLNVMGLDYHGSRYYYKDTLKVTQPWNLGHVTSEKVSRRHQGTFIDQISLV